MLRPDPAGDALRLKWLLQHVRRLAIEFQTLIAFGVVALGFLGFVAVAEDLMEGETPRFDTSVLLAMRVAGDPSDPIGPPWFERAMADLTALGGYAILTLLLIASIVYLSATGKWRTSLLVFGAVSSGTLLSSLLKQGFDRPRPELVDHLTHATSSSFPSGHATLSAVAYLTLGLLMARAHEHLRVRILIVVGAVAVTVLVGVSRVYLGVHWPTDVLAGWCLGSAWAAIWWLIASRLTP